MAQGEFNIELKESLKLHHFFSSKYILVQMNSKWFDRNLIYIILTSYLEFSYEIIHFFSQQPRELMFSYFSLNSFQAFLKFCRNLMNTAPWLQISCVSWSSLTTCLYVKKLCLRRKVVCMAAFLLWKRKGCGVSKIITCTIMDFYVGFTFSFICIFDIFLQFWWLFGNLIFLFNFPFFSGHF